MKIAGTLLSLLVILLILSSIDLAFATPSISIETSGCHIFIGYQCVYEYGEYLVTIISVSEITGDDGYIYITDPAERRSLLLQQPISQEYTEFPSKFPFDATIWKEGRYILDRKSVV